MYGVQSFWEATSSHLLNNFPAFHGTKPSLTHSQEPASDLYPKPDQPTPYHPILFL
jgi:hypothetical protein